MFVILLILIISTYLLFRFYQKTKELPPGPTPLPFIGNLHQLAWNLYFEKDVIKVMQKWQKEYGDVFTWSLGNTAIVNICEYQLANEAMIKKGANFASRPYKFMMDLMREGKGVIESAGQHWVEQRRFSLHTLRNFGLGRNLMQDRIMLEYDYRTRNLNKDIAKAGGSLNFDPYNFIELTVGNIINCLLFSDRFTEDGEKRFFKLKKEMDEMIENMGFIDFMIDEWNHKIPPFKQRWERMLNPLNSIVDFISEQIEQRKQDIASGKHALRDEGEDFVDAFLIEMQKKEHGSSFEEHSLKMTLLDLWAAGQETTTTTLSWALNYLILHPEVDRKLKVELDEITGRNRSLELADKPKTPYLNATILEILRVSSIVPMNLWREAEDDVMVGSYKIPKGAVVSAQLSLLMANMKIFPEPEKFKPERFLEPGLEQHVTPFGLGKRACLGESLARAELYLIFGNLVLNYDFSPDPAHPPSMSPRDDKGINRRTKKYHVNLSLRK